MTEKCIYAYRKNGTAAVMCKAIKKGDPYCGHQYMCHNTKRWEANPAVRCSIREKANK